MTTPLLLVGDAPTAGTGLGRILSDVASRVATNLSDVYDLATVGYGGIASRHLPYRHYTAEGMNGWILPTLPEIWEDWAGKERGVVMFLSDPARLGWFSRPEMSEELAKYPDLKKFLTKPPFKKWIYAPLDASGPNDKLTFPLAQNLLGFDRILAYGKWGEDVIRRTLGDQESEKRGLTSLPHGINLETFYPRERKTARAFFFSITGAANLYGKKELIKSDEILIGCVCTNQSRKDIPLLIETASILSRKHNVRLWLHTDVLERVGCWSIPALLVDFGMVNRTITSLGHIPDDNMASAYSACNITIAPGAEGFGFPIAESLAVGVPVVTGNYAGGAELAPLNLVDPVAFRYESIWSCERPVYNAKDWADKVNRILEYPGAFNRSLDSKYDWKVNWGGWEKWLREGVK